MNEHPGRLLLLSNSRNYGGGYLDHAEDWIRSFLGEHIQRAVFVPYAGVTLDWDDYAARVSERFGRFNVRVTSVHRVKHAVKEIESADAVIVGGGNTFHLLKQLYDNGTLWAIRERVLAGVPYIGWSAGSNVACAERSRPHHSLDLLPPSGRPSIERWAGPEPMAVKRRDRLGGLLHEYHRAA